MPTGVADPPPSSFTDEAACSGDAGTPTAVAGTLCLYFENVSTNVEAGSLDSYSTNAASRNTFFFTEIADTAGFLISTPSRAGPGRRERAQRAPAATGGGHPRGHPPTSSVIAQRLPIGYGANW